MSWFSGLFGSDSQKTFDQDLELLVARWTDVSRKGREALPIKEIGERLLRKAEIILDERRSKKK